MKKTLALILVIILCSFSMVSCHPYIFSLVHKLTDKTPEYFTYTDFTDEEKEIFNTHIGFVIPFLPTDRYTFGAFYDDDNYDNGIRFSTFFNTREDFGNYLSRLTDFTLSRTETDEYGDTWYYYTKDGVVLATAFYRTSTFEIIDIFVYIDETEEQVERGSLKNDGKGLPNGQNGVYRVDFSNAEYAKNVSDLNNYLNSCPATGAPAILVIPVQFSDATAEAKGYKISNIEKAFTGKTGETSYYSVEEYYYISSYGKLDLEVTVVDEWFTPKYPSSYYLEQFSEELGPEQSIGDQMIMDEALDYLDDRMDLSKFDSDGNGYIDAVIMINTLTVSNEDYFYWAYRFWNMLTDEEGELSTYDGVKANDYAWMSYEFIHEGADRFGRTVYTDKSIINPKTYIHEFGHIIGAEDYYDTTYEDPLGPLHGKDMMDASIGDHNPLTKFNYGWIDSSRLVTTEGSVTLTLEDFQRSGDTIIIANNFDPTLGVYQEYFVLMYYSPSGLNNSARKYFEYEGIVIYHVNASLYYEKSESGTFYTPLYSNASSITKNSLLLELVGINIGVVEIPYYIFTEGRLITGLTDDSGALLPYVITINSISGGKATITFKKVF